jgi:hypothetical protein
MAHQREHLGSRQSREVVLPVRQALCERPSPSRHLTRCRLISRLACLPERVVAVKTYQVTAKRWEHGYELHIEGVGVTQSRTVKDAEAMIRDYLHLEGITEPYELKIEFRTDDGERPSGVTSSVDGTP